MDKQVPHIPHLELKGLDKSQISQPTKRTINIPNSHLNLAKVYLNKEILSECLENFDLFKEMLGDPIQRIKIIRDVSKALRLKAYDQDRIIYNKGENSTSIYMVIKGNVSLCMPVFKESQQNIAQPLSNQKMEFEYQQIDMFKKGEGFGQAQFIHGRKRSLIAKAKVDNTIIGVIDGKDFVEVIESYKQRVYFKKIQMFSKCPLLHNLLPYQLQFIVNNAKPFVFAISKEIAKQQQKAKALYLITQGQVQLRKTNEKQQQKMNKFSTKNKISLQQAVRQKIKIKTIVVGVLQQGGFLGDGQIALDTPYDYSAICKSQKVRAYICDERIILSQMTEQNFKSAKQYYLSKKQYRQNKSNIYQEAKCKIQKRIEDNQVIILDKNQMKIKRMISNRYVQKRPSLIDQMSPRDIGKIVDIKYSKLKQTLNTDQSQINYFPSIHPKFPFQMLRADQKTYSPLLKRAQMKQERKYSQASSPSPIIKSSGTSNSLILPYHQTQKKTIPTEIPEPNSLLVLMQPFHRKVQSLHQRLAKQYNNTKKQKKRQLDKISAKLHSQPQVQLRRMSQFISKIKEVKKR